MRGKRIFAGGIFSIAGAVMGMLFCLAASALGATKSVSVNNVAPAPPANLSVSQIAPSGGDEADPSRVEISWSASPSGSPDSYSVEHNQSSTSWDSIYGGGGLNTQDQNLLGNARHFYRVRAHNQYGWSGYSQYAVYSFPVSAALETKSWNGGDSKTGFLSAFINPPNTKPKFYTSLFSYSGGSSNGEMGITSGGGWTYTSVSTSVDLDTRVQTSYYYGTTSYTYDEIWPNYEVHTKMSGSRDYLTGAWTGTTTFNNGGEPEPISGPYEVAFSTDETVYDTPTETHTGESTSYTAPAGSPGTLTKNYSTSNDLSDEYTTTRMIAKAWQNAADAETTASFAIASKPPYPAMVPIASYWLDKDTEVDVSLTQGKYHFKSKHNAVFRESWYEVTVPSDSNSQPISVACSWSSNSSKDSGDYSVNPPEDNCSIGLQFKDETTLTLYDDYGTLDAIESQKTAIGVTSFYVGPGGTQRHVSVAGAGFTVKKWTSTTSVVVSGAVTLSESESGFFTVAINTKTAKNSKSRLNIAAEAFDSEGKSLKTKNATIALVSMELSFEKVGDNWEIEDNKDADGTWMPGGGKRMFVDAKTPSESAMRDTVYVKVKSDAPEGWKVKLKAFDVDDPTTDKVDPNHVIDTNDTATRKQGNDNRGYDSLGIQQPPYFVSSTDETVVCTIDSQGVARLDNGQLPKLQMTDHPGDNVRVAAIFLKSDGTPMYGQSLDDLQVDNSTQPGYLPPSDDYPKDGQFTGAISPMLTVWRKLNVEVDSMTAVPTSGDQKNYEEGTILGVEFHPEDNTSTVTLSVLLTGPKDRYENGYLTVSGVSYEVVSNTNNWTDFTYGDEVVLKGNVPSSIVGQAFTIVDDDDKFLAQLGLPAPLPRNQYHEDIIKGIRPKYAPAYIQVEDANTLGWNARQTIPFKLNATTPDSLTGNVFGDAKDLTDKKVFWAFTVTIGYQPDDGRDHDPETEGLLKGGGAKYGIGNASFGYAAIYIESIREGTVELLSKMPPSTLNNTAVRQQIVDSYNSWLLGVIAHEIGHSTGADSAGQDHDEGGLMTDGAARIQTDFSAPTINRFRNAEMWTH